MLLLKVGLLWVGGALAAAAFLASLVALWRSRRDRAPLRLRPSAALAGAAVVASLVSQSMTLIPAGSAGVRVSQWKGAVPGTMRPGVHFLVPFVETVALFDSREQLLVTAAGDDAHKGGDALRAQSKEGLPLGLAVGVRYRLDLDRLAYIYANLPQPPAESLVPPVVQSTFRKIVPNYMVREVFATKRAEVSQLASDEIIASLARDGILVKEVTLRDVGLPPEYSKGLEKMLLKEQENERMVYELQVKEKEVRRAELEADADKARQVKNAEAQAQVRVLQAKAEADAMQHTLPLKGETDPAVAAGSAGAQGDDADERRGRRASQGDRLEGGAGAASADGRRRVQPGARDLGGRAREAAGGGGLAAEQPAPHPEDRGGAALRQDADHDGADGRPELLRQRDLPLGGVATHHDVRRPAEARAVAVAERGVGASNRIAALAGRARLTSPLGRRWWPGEASSRDPECLGLGRGRFASCAGRTGPGSRPGGRSRRPAGRRRARRRGGSVDHGWG